MTNQVGLSYDQAPPLGVPMAYFLTAPFFLLLAALGALADPDGWLPSRWMPASLALTHLLALGFLGLIMLGALVQMLPVVLGSPVPRARLLSRISLAALVPGVPLLGLGLWLGQPGLLTSAMALLGLGLLPLLLGLGVSLARMPGAPWLAWPVRQAWLGLGLTLALGISLAGSLAGHWTLVDAPGLTGVHAAWGLGGWTLLLVLGFSFQVVPMLQLTPPYPAWTTRWLAWLTFAGLPAFSLAVMVRPEQAWLTWLALVPTLAGGLAFAVATLRLQKRRRRKIEDATLHFWRLGLAMLAACALILPASPWLPESAVLGLGIAFLLGFAASAVNGMLYKIVPFLAWFHLQAQTQAHAGHIPNMKQLLPEAAAALHFRLHAAALLLLLAAAVIHEPARDAALWMARAGALALALSALVLWRNLAATVRLFRQHGGRL